MMAARAPRVILRRCPDYDVERVRGLAREAMEELGLRPFGRTLVKPNLVAAGPLFPHACTRPEFAEGLLRALGDRAGDGVDELAVGERCGITIPSRVAFSQSGFDAMLARVPGVRRYLFDEVPQVEVRYTHPERLRDYVFVPEPVARADFFVSAPKFKAHPWTTVTFSLKNCIGLQDDRHRLIDHDHRLDEKIADLQHVVQPNLVAIDAVIAGQGRMLTPRPFPLGLAIFGDNAVATDAVCCAIIGVDPQKVGHIRLAERHGFGTADLARIRVLGDVTLEEARATAAGFEVGRVRVEQYFQGTRVAAYAGPPPAPASCDYCWGGCPGAIEEAIEILRRFDDRTDARMPRLHVVFGAYRGPIDAAEGEKVVFVGDCAEWSGRIAGREVRVAGAYRDRAERDPRRAVHEDLYRKMWRVRRALSRARRDPVVRLSGCPVSVAEQVLALATLAGTRNPYFDVRNALSFNAGYLAWRARRALDRLRGRRYQRDGVFPRGAAAPVEPPTGRDLL